ncbi:signal peptidase I [Knoellia sinensis KCTC 19936]|uniref:Signal peptidase I n=1 Tax=Knoellia sinensis KCTC 19936 TaxID=1385520 RepID=A0A0A0J6G7_9MICO|nr:signal peptidase I [Knoellia sinensis KCTC 19936]
MVLLVLAALLLVALFAAVEPLRVASGSMSPALEVGDRVVVDKVTLRFDSPRAGELVVFREPDGGELVVKRVVALGGQTVGLEDAVLMVDGVARHEAGIDLSRIDSTYFGPVTVPADSVFVLGDNRADSIDSRSYGSIAVDALVGRVVLAF